jgi:hypothetical protein
VRTDLLVCTVVALSLASCAASGENGDGAPEVVTGTVVAVALDGGAVRSFRVVADGRRTYEIAIADDVDYGFDLTHLLEHQKTGDPVAVRVRQHDGGLIAQSIEDA